MPDQSAYRQRSPRADEPVERVPSYADRTGLIVRIVVIALVLAVIVGGVAHMRFAGRDIAVSRQIAALTPDPNARLMPVPPAAPPAPLPQAKPKPKAALAPAPVSDGPTPAPLASPSGPPVQTIDVDPKTPQVLSPIPDQVAPAEAAPDTR